MDTRATTAAPSYFGKPGLHSYNRARFTDQTPSGSGLKIIRILLLLIGLAGLGYYVYTLADQQIYQAYGNWAFEQQIAGRANVTFADYVREKTPFGFFAGSKTVEAPPKAPVAPQPARPADGSVIGRVEIERLHLSAIVRQGVDDKVLSEAVGHVPSTALAGENGNFAIAAHRDTLFRALKDIHKDDLISFQSTAGKFVYRVAGTKIVKPTDVSVLRPDGGGVIPETTDQPPQKLLTMITCYPFYFVGSAPKRFIVQAELVTPQPAVPAPSK